MESEIFNFEPSKKSEIQPKIRKYRIDFDALKREIKIQNDNFNLLKEKEILYGNSNENEETKSVKAKLLNTERKMREQNEKLEGAKRTIYETDKVSFEIMGNLESQNQQAAKTRGKVRDVTGNLSESDSIISRMLRREKITQIALAGITGIVILVLLIIAIKKIFG